MLRVLICGLSIIEFSVIAQSRLPAADSPSSIRFGMSTALTGPAANLGLNMRAGVLAAFDEANRAGGSRGRLLELVSLDDGYEPSRTVPNMRRLTADKKVLAVIGNVGTPTAVVAIPLAIQSRTLFYGAFSGAGVLRKPIPERYVINFRASYAEETEAMVDALVNIGHIRPEEIGFFTQRDAYGDAGFSGGMAALKKHGLKELGAIPHGRYERNTLAVENGLADLLSSQGPLRAVIMVGAYAPCAKFIKLAHEFDFRPAFLNVSFVGATSLAAELGSVGYGIIVTQVVPHYESDVSIVNDYRNAMRLSNQSNRLGFESLEGYIAGRILLLALNDVDGGPDRESIIDALQGLGRFDLGLGDPLRLSVREHQASHTVWATVIRDGEVQPFQWEALPALLAD